MGLKNTMNKIKMQYGSINCRSSQEEERNYELKGYLKIHRGEQRMKMNEDSLQDLWNSIKRAKF